MVEAIDAMTSRQRRGRDRRLRLRSIRRDPPDFERLAAALIELTASQTLDDSANPPQHEADATPERLASHGS
jgi:hypothetical protein